MGMYVQHTHKPTRCSPNQDAGAWDGASPRFSHFRKNCLEPSTAPSAQASEVLVLLGQNSQV